MYLWFESAQIIGDFVGVGQDRAERSRAAPTVYLKYLE
jgi:hypothetical protein